MLALIDPHITEIRVSANSSSGEFKDLCEGDIVIFDIFYDNRPTLTLTYMLNSGYFLSCQGSSDNRDDYANDLLFRRLSTNIYYQDLFIRQFRLAASHYGNWIEMATIEAIADELMLIENLIEF